MDQSETAVHALTLSLSHIRAALEMLTVAYDLTGDNTIRAQRDELADLEGEIIYHIRDLAEGIVAQ
jgi:hypothetical protein